MKTNRNTVSLFYKVLKVISITLVSLIILISAAIGVTLKFIFTPEKLTKIVLEQSAQFIDGEIKCEEIDLSFFSSFPNLELELKNGAIVPSSEIIERVKPDVDTLLRFETIALHVNPIAYLSSNRLSIPKVLISDANIYAFINKDGIANWDIAKISTTQETEDDSDESINFDSDIQIGKIEIVRANMTFDDRSTEIFTDLRNFSTTLQGDFSKTVCRADLQLNASNFLFWQEGKLLVNKLAFSSDMKIVADFPKHKIDIEKSVFEVNNMKIGFWGNLEGDSINKLLNVNIDFGMEIPSLKTLVDMVPVSIVQEAANAKAEGYFAMKGSITGVYGKDLLPVIKATAYINDGKIIYEGMPYSVDKLDLKAETCLDFKEKRNSFFVLEKFVFQGASSKINASAKITNLITSPSVRADIDADINFTELVSTFPIEEGVTLKGTIKSNLKGLFRIEDITNKDYGKINLNGFLSLNDVIIDAPKDSFLLDVKRAGFEFGANNKVKNENYSRELLNATIGFDGLNLESRYCLAVADSAYINFVTSPLIDTTSIASIKSSFKLGSLKLMTPDSTYLLSGKTTAKVDLKPSPQNKKKPFVKSEIYFEGMKAGKRKDVIALKNAGFSLSSVQSATNQRHWISNGVIGFESMKMFTEQFPLLITLPASKLTIEEDKIELHNAGVNIGKSDVRMSGKLSNLYEVFFNAGTLKGDLIVSSQFIDCNEIINALQPDVVKSEITADNIEQSVPVSESDTLTPMGIFIVPDKIDFTLSTDIKNVRFGNMDIEKIHGDLYIRNQAVELNNLSMHTMAADMSTSLVYKADNNTTAHAGFDLDMKDIRVGKLVELMPALDTLVPMLRSLDGLVNFKIAARTEFDENMDVKIPSLEAATRLKGDSLVLMDGETFTEISKMLRFKNKERNIIDSVAVDLVVRNGMIEIHPFLIGMDRYLAAVGGNHNIDMTFKYHVSLLESPLPFRAGVDISGNMDKFKFRVTKAKYKDLTKTVRVSPVDSTSVHVHNYIKNILNKGN